MNIGNQVVKNLREIVNPPLIDVDYLQRMINPIIEDPDISRYITECGEGLSRMVSDLNPQQALRDYELGMRKIALIIGLFYGREQQREIDNLEDSSPPSQSSSPQ